MSGSATDWPEVPIKSVCEAVVDCVNKTAPLASTPTPYRMLRTTNVRDGFVDTRNCRFVEEDTFRKWTRRQVPRRGDVILTREAPLGEVGMLRNDETVFLGQRLMSYRANPEKLDANFLLYSLMGPHMQAQIRALGSGATVEHIRVPDAENLLIRIPSLAVQNRIGATLSAYDELIEVSQRRIAILEEMARRLFDEWFVRFRYPGHKLEPHMKLEQGTVPQNWELLPLPDLAEITYGFPFKSRLFTSEATGRPVIRIRDIQSGISHTFTNENADPKYTIDDGDILIGMDGNFHLSTVTSTSQFGRQVTQSSISE